MDVADRHKLPARIGPGNVLIPDIHVNEEIFVIKLVMVCKDLKLDLEPVKVEDFVELNVKIY